MTKKDIKTREEARQYAIKWQLQTSDKKMYLSELQEWADYFEGLANKFDLTEEFKENGII